MIYWGDNLITKNILCYSQYDFDRIMKNNGWIDDVPKGVSCISICSSNEGNEHWFKKSSERIFNIDIDDDGPFWFGKNDANCYDKSLVLYNNGNIKKSNNYFSYNNINILNYEQAFKLVNWIDKRIKEDEIIYIHCSAGISRSQGIVRYILDIYKEDYDIKTNPNNPCLTPNIHIVLMLKRACRQIYYYSSNYEDIR